MASKSLRRKLAIATWSRPTEGNIYARLTVNVGEALKYLEHLRQTTGEKVTLTHLVGKACGLALKREPMLNGRICLGRYVPHKTVDVSFLVALEEGQDLARAKVREVDQKSVVAIARELRQAAERLRRGEDAEFKKSQGPLRYLPTWLIRPVLWATGLLTGSFGVGVKMFGLEPFPFGACVITSVGMFGVDEAFVPPIPFARVPAVVLVGAVREAPAVVDGRVTVTQQMTITATIDHRFIDGYQGAILAKTMREVLEDPWRLEGSAV